MPVHEADRQKDKWYWTCEKCVKAHGVFGTEKEADDDLNIRHAKVCSGRSSK